MSWLPTISWVVCGLFMTLMNRRADRRRRKQLAEMKDMHRALVAGLGIHEFAVKHTSASAWRNN